MIVDSHCHLNYLQNDIDDLAPIIERAGNVGVKYIQTISTNMKDFPTLLKITKKYNNVFCSAGVHPCYVKENPLIKTSELIQASKHDSVIALGETGIDLFHDKTTLDIQIKSFITHIEVARKTGLPVIVHNRNADDEIIQVMKKQYDLSPYPALIHCFSSDARFAKFALDLGFYISLSGILTFPKSQQLREVVATIPSDRLLIETDSPYLSPKPHRGKTCEPSFVVHTLECLAEVKNTTCLALGKQTTDNFFNLFKKAKR
jgi:TatD DNase family protein